MDGEGKQKSKSSERMQALRTRIEVLREHTRTRLLLLEEERKQAADKEESYGDKFKALMSEFAEKKKQIKNEFKGTEFNQEVLKKHYIEISRQQVDTINEQSRLRRMIQRRGEKKLVANEGGVPAPAAVFRFSSKSLGWIDKNNNSTSSLTLPNAELDKVLTNRRHSSSGNGTLDTTFPPSPTSPRALERFLTKYPHKSVSREPSVCDEQHSEVSNAHGTTLDQSQSDDPFEPNKSKEDVSAHRRDVVEEFVGRLWKELSEKGADYGEWDISVDLNVSAGEEEAPQIPDYVLQQWCLERVQGLVRSDKALSRKALASKDSLMEHLQTEMVADSMFNRNAPPKGICSEGVTERAMRNSHLAMDTNRLLLAKYAYETGPSVWPSPDVLFEVDLAVIDALLEEDA